MVINRIVTTKQKKFLEKTFECLGINIEDVMELNNIKTFREETQKEIKELKEANAFLTQVNTTQNEVIKELNFRIEELNQKIDELMFMTDDEA